jgi:hypothetical protein
MPPETAPVDFLKRALAAAAREEGDTATRAWLLRMAGDPDAVGRLDAGDGDQAVPPPSTLTVGPRL